MADFFLRLMETAGIIAFFCGAMLGPIAQTAVKAEQAGKYYAFGDSLICKALAAGLFGGIAVFVLSLIGWVWS